MASPQAENGHVDLANELVEALAKIRISGEEMQCLWVVFRKTYGWKKKEDWIALSQFQDMTGINQGNVGRALRRLLSKNIIVKKDNRKGVTYGIQKDYSKWKPLSKKTPVVNNDNKGSQKRQLEVSIKTTTKDTTTKDTITKERKILSGEVIDYLNEVLDTKYQKTGQKIKTLIKARQDEGHTLDDFKKVIDIKHAEWKDDKKFSKFLRPETLFGTKFESYLNQKPPERQIFSDKTKGNFEMIQRRAKEREEAERQEIDNGKILQD